MDAFTAFLYVLALGFLGVSAMKDPEKTKAGLKKGLKSFLYILPDFAAILAIVGVLLTFISPQIIAGLVGQETGFWGMLVTSLVGAITLIPGFVAFPLAKSLLDMGAGIQQMAVFISTLMMVGTVTAPLEIKFFGKKETILRNSFSYVFSFVVALVIGAVVNL